jgi:tetratricopeptide (TPR) repeat protein
MNQPASQTVKRVRALKAVGQLAEAAKELENALAQRTPEQLELLYELVDIRAKQGGWYEADRRIEQALEVIANSDDKDARVMRASLLERRAWIYFRQGRLREAEQVATTIAKQLDEKHLWALAASVHNTLGGVAWQEGRLDEAIKEVNRSAELYEAAGDRCGMAIAKTNAGVLNFSTGHWPEATTAFAESDRIRSDMGWTTGRASNLLNLGWLKAVVGDHDNARKHLEESLRLATLSGEEYDIAHAEIAIAHLDFLDDRIDAAYEHLDSVLKRECVGDDDVVQAQWLQALIECHRGGAERGVGIASAARLRAQKSNLIESEADACRTLGIAYTRCEDFHSAEKCLTEALALAERTGDPYRRGLALLEMAALYEQAAERQPNDPEAWRKTASANAKEAETVFSTLGARPDLQRAQQLSARLSR